MKEVRSGAVPVQEVQDEFEARARASHQLRDSPAVQQDSPPGGVANKNVPFGKASPCTACKRNWIKDDPTHSRDEGRRCPGPAKKHVEG